MLLCCELSHSTQCWFPECHCSILTFLFWQFWFCLGSGFDIPYVNGIHIFAASKFIFAFGHSCSWMFFQLEASHIISTNIICWSCSPLTIIRLAIIQNYNSAEESYLWSVLAVTTIIVIGLSKAKNIAKSNSSHLKIALFSNKNSGPHCGYRSKMTYIDPLFFSRKKESVTISKNTVNS